jgi:hypothetical protein
MTDIATRPDTTLARTGAPSFSDLVHAHFRWERERHANGRASPEAEEEYRRQLEAFEQEEGKIAAVYWSTREPSAVALTFRDAKHVRNPIADTETETRLHRVSDWVTTDVPRVADLLHQCDLLAIRVAEVLRGTSERIAMRWLLAVQAHLLGYLERRQRGSTTESEDEVVGSQLAELVKIERYYHRAGTKAGRIVYVSGMLLGLAALAVLVALVAMVLWAAETSPAAQQAVLVSIGGGALGALVSAMARMGAGADRFKVDFEVGRPLLRRLGFYRPLVGAVFGVAVYFLLASGVLTEPAVHDGREIYFWGTVAFLAGFSERFTNVIFGGAERVLGGSAGREEADRAAAEEEERASSPGPSA